MQRRKMVSLMALGLASIKSAFFVSEASAATSSDNRSEIALDTITDFSLPDNPKHGETILFLSNNKPLLKPVRIIPTPQQTIMGAKETLEVDIPANFSLCYDQPSKCWLFQRA